MTYPQHTNPYRDGVSEITDLEVRSMTRAELGKFLLKTWEIGHHAGYEAGRHSVLGDLPPESADDEG
jgi:hypothetical protein